MIALRLTREVMNASCCRGKLEVLDSDGEIVKTLFTIEKPWIPSTGGGLAGEPFRSCVSEGAYALSPFVRPNGDKVWMLSNPDLDVFKLDTDIPPKRQGKGRFLILIHAANRARDVVGCIGPGRSTRTEANGTLMVTSSRDAMADLHKQLDGRRNLEIEIINEKAAFDARVAAGPAAAAPAAAAITRAADASVADATKLVEFWLGIPGNSTMTITATGSDATHVFTASGKETREDGPVSNFPIQPTAVRTFAKSHGYQVEVNVTFVTDATATITADVKGSAGQAIPPTFRSVVPGKKGQVTTIRFFVTTL
jgi:hypothetical protein